MKKKNLLRQLTIAILLLVPALPVCAQEKTDSVFSFRFLTGNDMFYVPLGTNGKELARLFDYVDRYKSLILNHDMMVHVNGYCNLRKNKLDNLAIAKIRSNRVKSELITRKGLKENCFVTKNHVGEGNFVLVNLVVSKDLISKYEKQQPAPEITEKEAEPEKIETIDNSEQQETYEQSEEPVNTEVEAESDTSINTEVVNIPTERVRHFALKTNLLDYAVLMPNVEIEWMFANRWSVAVEGQEAWYAKETPHKVYRIATVIPEVRYWVIDRARWHGMYVGIFGGRGWYDLCNGKKGHEGEGNMAGVSAGYMWPISKYFSLDGELGLGYMYIRDKVYLPEDGHYLYQYTKKIKYFGPLRAKLSLVWRF